MQQVQISDRLYKEAQRRAAEAGFSTVDDYVAEVLTRDSIEGPEDFGHLFTPERLAHINAAAAQIDAGQFFTTEQADAELARRRAEWLQKHPG
jgi:hypothetical protein